MQKFKLEVTRKNGNKRTVTVYLDDTTAQLFKETGDLKLLDTYLREEYKASRKAQQEAFWNQSLDEAMENGNDYEDRHRHTDFSFDDMDNEAAFEVLYFPSNSKRKKVWWQVFGKYKEKEKLSE